MFTKTTQIGQEYWKIRYGDEEFLKRLDLLRALVSHPAIAAELLDNSRTEKFEISHKQQDHSWKSPVKVCIHDKYNVHKFNILFWNGLSMKQCSLKVQRWNIESPEYFQYFDTGSKKINYIYHRNKMRYRTAKNERYADVMKQSVYNYPIDIYSEHNGRYFNNATLVLSYL